MGLRAVACILIPLASPGGRWSKRKSSVKLYTLLFFFGGVGGGGGRVGWFSLEVMVSLVAFRAWTMLSGKQEVWPFFGQCTQDLGVSLGG